MAKWYVADSYKDYEICEDAFENEKGKMYIKIKKPCSRCGGLGLIISHVENGRPIPIPVDNGICYRCKGSRFEIKEVRAYTEKEYQRLQKTKELLKVKKDFEEQTRKQDLIDNADVYKQDIAIKLGFSDTLKAYVVYGGDTYAIKDKLKEMGARFDPVLKWYFSTKVELPEDYKLAEIDFDDVYEYKPLVKRADYLEDAQEKVNEIIARLEGPSTSEYFPANEKERIRNITAKVSKIRGFQGMYGYTSVYCFTSGNYVFVWMTSKDLPISIGDVVDLTGTIKKFDEYMGEKQTYLTRCIVKVIHSEENEND